jgi:hypothetical protein
VPHGTRGRRTSREQNLARAAYYRITSTGGAKAPPAAKYIDMNRWLYFCLALLLPACGLAQGEGFNVRFHLGLPAVILNSVAAADSCYYGAALVADSVPPYRSGAAFIKFGPDGGILDYNWVVDSVSPYETWDGDLVELEGGVFAINGYTYDTVMKALLLFWDADGELIARRSYPNFFLPRRVRPGYRLGADRKPAGHVEPRSGSLRGAAHGVCMFVHGPVGRRRLEKVLWRDD